MSAPETVSTFLKTFGSGDIEGAGAYLADDATGHFPGRNPVSGEYAGKDAFLGMMRAIQEHVKILNIEIHAAYGDEEHAVLLVTRTLERNGETKDFRNVQVYHVDGGKITELWIHEADQYAFDAFFE